MNWDRLSPRVEVVDGCWLWRGTVDRDGYGVVKIQGRQWRVHRLAYLLLVGEVAADLRVGHVCHDLAAMHGECAGGTVCVHRRCCNPDHLVQMSNAENLRASSVTVASANLAKTHCPAGHPYDRVQLRDGKVRQRYCRACKRAAWRRWNEGRT